jgi:two-component system, chemotaxis family, protein-glutamate methylesterase/glutaminase
VIKPSLRKIRVLIVDDSSMMRHLLKDLLTTDPLIEVVGTAIDPYEAREKLVELKPDVMTLDVEMPKMDGITFLEKVMKHQPVRTLIISSLTQEGSALALKALSVGALDVLAKPKLDLSRGITEMAAQITASVKNAAQANLPRYSVSPAPALSPAVPEVIGETTQKVIALAASTGGTEALKVLLSQMPTSAPGIVVVQHMPPVFTRHFAELLRTITRLDVREAKQGDRVLAGSVLIAPGDHHLEVVRSGSYYCIALHQQPPLHGVRPAADYLFRSVAKNVGPNAAGAILTGLGGDGAQGLLALKEAGGLTIAQDEETCVIYGMPKEAVRLGAATTVLPLEAIPSALLSYFNGVSKAAA